LRHISHKGGSNPQPLPCDYVTVCHGCVPFGDVKFVVGVTKSSIVFASVNTKPMTRQQWRENVFWQGMWDGQKI